MRLTVRNILTPDNIRRIRIRIRMAMAIIRPRRHIMDRRISGRRYPSGLISCTGVGMDMEAITAAGGIVDLNDPFP
jgi:hypothetical protein